VAGGQGLIIPDGAAVLADPGGWVGRAARCQPGLVLFRAASRRSGLDGFPIIRLSSDYCVRTGAGCLAWIRSWQEAQTTRVLRRRFAMALAHWGCSGPGAGRSLSLRTWWTSIFPVCWRPSPPTGTGRRPSQPKALAPGYGAANTGCCEASAAREDLIASHARARQSGQAAADRPCPAALASRVPNAVPLRAAGQAHRNRV
jgi:hypothetical protein